jgi:imidazolonepropionase-like amidohydrolase
MTLFNKNYITKSFAALGLMAASTFSFADSLAITNATVHTAAEQGVLQNATVLIEDGVITAINPASHNADKVYNAKGKMLTPGIIVAMNRLGLEEVGAVARTRDAGDDKADITFDPGLAFNPHSTVIPYTRKGGITSSVIAPSGGKSIFAGQTSVVNLSGEFDSTVKANNAVVVKLGSKSKGSRAIGLQTLINKLEDAQKSLAKIKEADKKDPKDKKDKEKADKEPSREDKEFFALLKGEKPIVIHASRASDLLRLIEVKQRFNLDMIIDGADDAVVVASQLAKADVAVVIDALQNLPVSFDSMHAALENAGILSKAGVKVMFNNGGTRNSYQMRFYAGNAISYGMSKENALKALTANVADAFNINAGTIEVGKSADLVLWTGDMFELSSFVEQLWIGGKAYSTQSRHDKLRERYMKKSDMPPAYSK